MKTSVIIPACNESLLYKTIESVLSTSKGDVEVIPVCEGYKPDLPDDPRIKPVYNEKPVGQRNAVNQGATMATGEYVMKLDAHCKLSEGWDEVLKADCPYEWTIVPRMYVLDGDKFEPKWRKKTDFMYISSIDSNEPFRIQYYDANCYRKHKEEYRAYKKAKWRQGDICPTMACIGACFFMHKDRYWELGGMDEKHGHWGQMGVEVGLKAWLSGGALMVNKKAWFAHLWRRKAPWHHTQKSVDEARAYSQDLWLNNKWPLQKYPISWLIDKFKPVPSWKGTQMDSQDLTVLYYTANRIPDKFRDKVLEQLKFSIGNTPIVSVSQKPMKLGKNVCVGEIGASLQNIYKQVVTGLKEVETPYVALVEDDCLYVPEHFNLRPKNISYNINRWLLHADRGNVYSFRNRPILSQCIAPTKTLLDCLAPRMDIDVPKKFSGEPGLFERKLGLPEYPYDTFVTQVPNLVICHEKNTSGRKTWGTDAPTTDNLPPYGDAKELLGKLGLNGHEEIKLWKHSQHSYIGSKIFDINELMDKLHLLDDPRTRRGEKRTKAFEGIVRRIADNENLTDDDLKKDPCYKYFQELHESPKRSSKWVNRRSIQLMKEWQYLFNDIRIYGLKNPLDMWRTKDGGLVLCRGWRRLIIMNELHKRKMRDFSKVPARIFKSLDLFRKFNPSVKWSVGSEDGDTINSHARKQFMRLKEDATDKYWVHNYTPLYDRHIGFRKKDQMKILEIGVFKGSSLLLWEEYFNKSEIWGVDKNTAIWRDNLKGHDRIGVCVGRTEDETFMKSEVIPKGPFDIIIDDGSHAASFQLKNFDLLWPHVNRHGFYVIEDLHGNYWKKRSPRGPLMIDRIKELLTDVYDSSKIRSVTNYYNICFIEKI